MNSSQRLKYLKLFILGLIIFEFGQCTGLNSWIRDEARTTIGLPPADPLRAAYELSKNGVPGLVRAMKALRSCRDHAGWDRQLKRYCDQAYDTLCEIGKVKQAGLFHSRQCADLAGVAGMAATEDLNLSDIKWLRLVLLSRMIDAVCTQSEASPAQPDDLWQRVLTMDHPEWAKDYPSYKDALSALCK